MFDWRVHDPLPLVISIYSVVLLVPLSMFCLYSFLTKRNFIRRTRWYFLVLTLGIGIFGLDYFLSYLLNKPHHRIYNEGLLSWSGLSLCLYSIASLLSGFTGKRATPKAGKDSE